MKKTELLSTEEITKIREKARRHPEYVDDLKASTSDLFKALYIQKSGKATWSHYFTCPFCCVTLNFNYDDPYHYECPSCHRFLEGEPYEGAWWEKIVSYNAWGAFRLSVLFLITDEEKYLSMAKKILLGYAENYKNYEVHGDIPYNHPGRFASQALTDSIPLANLACAFAAIRRHFTASEQELIETNLFYEAAKHQMKYSTDQIHNHEVVICSSLGIIGLVIGNKEILDFALERKYGLKYQLDHAVLEDGLWFESSLGYHGFALEWLTRFNMLAEKTEYSLLSDPHYSAIIRKMLDFIAELATTAGFPKFNDGSLLLNFNNSIFLEYAYTKTRDENILKILCKIYETIPRNHIMALIYGVDTLPAPKPFDYKNHFSTSGSNLAVLHGKNTEVWFKATPYGGEHDHYDRLALSLISFGRQTSADLGTASGYGAPLHYSYFKNTASHNTVVINGDNMPPCDTHVTRYEEIAPDRIYLEAVTDTPESHVPLDSFTIKQWNSEAYEGVRYKRAILWCDSYLIDVFTVKSQNELRKEWVWHTDAQHAVPSDAEYIGKISENGAQSHLHDAYLLKTSDTKKISYNLGDHFIDVYADTTNKDIILAYGPNNPSTSDVSYILERSCGKNVVYANVIDVYKNKPTIKNVEFVTSGNNITVRIKKTDGSTVEEVFNTEIY